MYATVPAEAVEAWREKSDQYQHQLHTATGLGNDFLGWINLPNEITDADFSAIEEAARDLQQRCDYVVSIGIGGSYLGARAVIEALTPSFEAYRREHSAPQVIFAGHNIGEDYLSELVDFLQDKRFGLINISKSGTTTEPAIAFRILKALLEKQVGREEARERIIAVTDKARGALRTLADKEGYKTFIIPDDIGGRFSVLTPVGLLPIAVAGFDIRELVRGAREMKALVDESVPFDQNPAALYAAARNSLYHEGKKIEILGNFHPRLHYIGEWWKQLYGESEGKDHKGIFNAAVDFSADLHSMGQWIQEGERNIFETIISIAEPNSELRIGQDEANLDGLNYLAGKRIDEVNKMAELGVRVAHIDGGVPNIRIVLPKLDAYYIGQLFYFFEKAVGISGYMLEVNPFNQPGVEAYKKNMFALLEKPGFEDETRAIKSRLQ
nr:glucose-6-phosphate isomerase [uncultured Porphyromonas sp.]